MRVPEIRWLLFILRCDMDCRIQVVMNLFVSQVTWAALRAPSKRRGGLREPDRALASRRWLQRTQSSRKDGNRAKAIVALVLRPRSGARWLSDGCLWWSDREGVAEWVREGRQPRTGHSCTGSKRTTPAESSSLLQYIHGSAFS